jgi:hypothetical protein
MMGKSDSATFLAISYREVSVDSKLPSLMSTVQKCTSLPETSKNQMYPIDVFTHYEVEGYKTLMQTVQSDLTLLQRRSKGEILTTPPYDDVSSDNLNHILYQYPEIKNIQVF